MKRKLASSLMVGVLAVTGLAVRIDAGTALIDVKTMHQKIRGFGTCSAWNGTLTAEEGRELWDTVTGAGLSLHRIQIQPDATVDAGERSNTKLAEGYGVKVWGTPWYSMDAVAIPNTNNDTLYESNMQPWADTLAGMLNSMASAGTPLYALSPQNESDLGWVHYDAKAIDLWVGKYLGPTIAKKAPKVKVLASETCNWYGFSAYEPVLIADTNVMKYTSIFATHEYGGTVMAYPAIQAAGKEFWETEIYDPITDVEDTGMGSALRVSGLIDTALTVANMNAWHYWWIKPCTNCYNGALWAATNRPTKRLWIMGNWSRFVRPGFVRVEAPVEPTTGVKITAFRDSALTKFVVVAINLNSNSVSQGFSFPNAAATSVTPYITDSTRNIVGQSPQSLASTSFTYSLPSKSVTTLVFNLTTSSSSSSSVASSSSSVVRTPYSSAAAIPGTVQAENYDNGGQGVAYNVNDSVNRGGVYRNDAISIGYDSAGSDYYVGWVMGGEWLNYTVNIAKAGTYSFTARASSTMASGRFTILLDGTPIANQIAVPNTGAWSTYTNITGTTNTLPAGLHTLQIAIDTAWFNLDWIRFDSTSNAVTGVVQSNSNIADALLSVKGNSAVLHLGHDMQGTLEVLDLFGKQHQLLSEGSLRAGDHEFTMNLSNGVYFVRLVSEQGGALTQKFAIVSP